ncbi:MAG: hypothetical protein ACFFDN_36810, partial [Candidatus Hodarchaeota archaeon]
MNKKKKTLLAFLLIVLFTCNTFGLILNNYQIPNTTHRNSKQPSNKEAFDEDLINEEPIEIETPKTADFLEDQQNLDFSFNTTIEETWLQGYYFSNYNSTEGNDSPDWMNLTDIIGTTFSFILYLVNIKNSSDGQLLNASNLHDMYFSYINQSLVRENISKIFDHPYHLINGTCLGTVTINEAFGAKFVIWNDWVENTNISYDAWMSIQLNKSSNVETHFIPTPENTQSDTITWELQYSGAHSSGDYDASLKVEELENFTIKRALGYNGQYWTPISYTNNETHIFIDEYFEEFKIELETPNYVSIIYNDNLTYKNNKNQLQPYVTCGMAGNLTIQLRVPNGTIINYTKIVNKGDLIGPDDFNYNLALNGTGGTGYLNVILSNSTLTNFGVKVCDISYTKQCVFGGMTSNTTAFSQFFVIMAYYDADYGNFLQALNQTDELNITAWEFFNMTMVRNATVTYELGELQGELEYQFFGGFTDAPNITVYWTVIDLSSYQIEPGEYNITYKASAPGYESLEITNVIVISKKEAFVQVISAEDVVSIEDDFLIALNVYEPGLNYLRTPVYLNLTFSYNDTGEVAVDVRYHEPAIQSIILNVTIENHTLPGVYNLTVCIDSEYYYGNTTYFLTIEKKKLEISVDHDATIRAGASTNFTWSLEDNNFQGNRANMSLQIIVDGELISHFNLTSNSTGSTIFNFEAGVHNITYRIVSPFYDAETTVIINAVSSSILPDDDDDDDDD